MTTQIVVDSLVKKFDGDAAVDGLSFSAASGQVLGILGPNGAGKTTVINILATLVLPDSGSATIAGFDVVTQAPDVRRSIALTGQFSAVDDILTGHENLVLFGRLRGLGRRMARSRADELLQEFSLGDAAKKRVSGYSGGMRRRLDLAASLVVPAPVVFLDEPTTGLDPRSRADLWNVIRGLKADGLTIVLTTQYLDEADNLADEIVVIDQGRLVAQGSPGRLKQMAGNSACVVSPVDPTALDTLVKAIADLGELVINRERATITMADAGPDALAAIVGRAKTAGIRLAEATLRRPTLEEAFLQLTAGDT